MSTKGIVDMYQPDVETRAEILTNREAQEDNADARRAESTVSSARAG
jgi:hypothetical protein